MSIRDIYCINCKKTFYLNMYRLAYAKTVTCIFCKKRILNKNKFEYEKEEKK